MKDENRTVAEEHHCSTIDMHNSCKASNLNLRKPGYLLQSFRHKIRKGKTEQKSEPKKAQNNNKKRINCTMPLLLLSPCTPETAIGSHKRRDNIVQYVAMIRVVFLCSVGVWVEGGALSFVDRRCTPGMGGIVFNNRGWDSE